MLCSRAFGLVSLVTFWGGFAFSFGCAGSDATDGAASGVGIPDGGKVVEAGSGGGDVTILDAGPGCPTISTYTELRTTIFGPQCSGRCHGGATQTPTPGLASGPIDFSSTSTRDQLVDRVSVRGMGLVLTIPGDPANSFLVQKLTNALPTDGSLGTSMPQGGQMLGQSQMNAITCWIAGGAP